MQRHQTFENLPNSAKGASVAMGNFDGVHLGHQSVLALARTAAASINAPLGVITFEPHPRRLFQPDAPAFRLMSAETKASRFEKLGLDHLYEIPFNADLAALTAQEFIERVLVWGLGVSHVVIGADFRFGKGRTGDTDTLVEAGKTHGFGVTIAPLVTDAKGDYSSTAIRDALTKGQPSDAARMLGHWHRIEGRVEKGDQRGRDLGYPTANLNMDGLHQPKYGVYAVIVDILTGPHAGRYHAAASMGVRPTFGVNHPNLESYIFDFSGDIYGEDISVALVDYIRPEETFSDVQALVVQMDHDCTNARRILENVAPI